MEDVEHPENITADDKMDSPTTSEKPVVFTPLSVQALGNKCLEVDGRVGKIVAYNAWMAIRCKRDNQDMGGLWDLRESYYRRNFSR